jgi:hypothetical protein
MEGEKIKAGDVISQEIVDLMAGLQLMHDGEGCYYQLERLETLAQLAHEIAADEVTWMAWNEQKICDLCEWQKMIVDEIRNILKNQDQLIMALKSRFAMPETEDFEADFRKLEALRGLPELFVCNGLYHGESTNLLKLKAWATAYGYDFEKVKCLLAKETESILQLPEPKSIDKAA